MDTHRRYPIDSAGVNLPIEFLTSWINWDSESRNSAVLRSYICLCDFELCECMDMCILCVCIRMSDLYTQCLQRCPRQMRTLWVLCFFGVFFFCFLDQAFMCRRCGSVDLAILFSEGTVLLFLVYFLNFET